MAGIPTRKVVLIDKWPGVPNLNLGIPTGGFDSTSGGNDVSDPAYPVGTKIQIYTDHSSCKGSSVLAYLHYYCFSGENAVEAISTAGGHTLFQAACNSTCVSADGTSNPFACTNSGEIDTGAACGTGAGICAVPCGTLSYSSTNEVTDDGLNSGRYGWFWVGGVAPCGECTIHDSANFSCISTAGGVAVNLPIGVEIDTSVVVWDGAEITDNWCGYALDTDS